MNSLIDWNPILKVFEHIISKQNLIADLADYFRNLIVPLSSQHLNR